MTFQVSDVSAWVAPTIVLGNLEAWRPSVEKDSACVLEKTIITILACVSSFVWFLLSTQIYNLLTLFCKRNNLILINHGNVSYLGRQFQIAIYG